MYGVTTAPIKVDGITIPRGTFVTILSHRPMSAVGHKVRITVPGVAGYLKTYTTKVEAA